MGKRHEVEDAVSWDKTTVLQEARQCFMATSVKTKKLVDILTKCIFVLYQERLAPTEATDLFFHITRLFQYKDKDSTLRRLTHIAIKALSQQAENVYVVTSSLTSDVNSSRDDPAIRASALRALCQISEPSTFTTIERYLKQGVVDKHPVVASAAITSLVHIGTVNGDIVKRCTNEIQEALNSDSPMVQYHALILRYKSWKNDRLAISRLISNCIQQGLRSPPAICLLIRIISNYVGDSAGEEAKVYNDYIKNHLNHRSEMVEYEAANALINSQSSSSSRKAAVAHLRHFLSSSKAASRFAAARSLNELATDSPQDVFECNLELENLISQSDCNRCIAIEAISALLKTCTEELVETYLNKIGEFLSDIDDDFKVTVVTLVRQLCKKFPKKHPAMMNFLSKMLREEGGYSYKKAIIETIIKMIDDNEETKEKGLEQLCEFIEDCEHDSLAVEVLTLLGREGPKSKKASTYIRFIANRLLLDASPVACAAITALAKFGTVPELSETIKSALNRFSLHEDYEVMERAVFYRSILSVGDANLNHKFITNPTLSIDLTDLETKLMKYLEGDCEKPFDMSTVASAGSRVVLHPVDSISPHSREQEPEQMAALNVFEDIDLGELLKSTAPVSLTDSVSEFGAQCVQHIYSDHIVLQINITNTVPETCLENVVVEMCAPEGFSIIAGTEIPKLAFEETAPVYVCAELLDDSAVAPCFKYVVMRYNYRTEDSEDSNDDVFPLEDITVGI